MALTLRLAVCVGVFGCGGGVYTLYAQGLQVGCGSIMTFDLPYCMMQRFCVVDHDQKVGAKGCYDYAALTTCLLWMMQFVEG